MDKWLGRQVWCDTLASPGTHTEFHSDVLLANDLVIVGTDGDSPSVYALDQRTGAIRWQHPVVEETKGPSDSRGVRTGITRTSDVIQFATYSGRLFCLDLKTGAQKWRFASPEFENASFGAFQQAVLGNRVFYGSPEALHALDAATGDEIWELLLHAPISDGIIVHDGHLYFGTADRHVYRVDPDHGEIERDLVTEHQPGFFQPLITGNALVVPSDSAHVIAAYDLDLKTEIWTVHAKEEWGSPRMATWAGMALAGNSDGQIVAIEPSDGSIRWTGELGGTVRGVSAADGLILAGNTRGDLVVFDPSKIPPRPVRER